ncbi:MAG TPA: hypothetical protein VJB57_21430 [Dehalococcoidia bacterium]|nr:hypothetical protein [Dehalococcoidia bacterium]
MLQALATPRDRTRTLIFLAICGAAAIAAALVGISDNPLGIFLVLAAGAAFVLAFVHPWRTPEQFGRLLVASGLGFVLFVVLHNVFEALAGTAEDIAVLHGLLEGLGGAAFLLATLVCLPAFLVSVVALVIVLIRNRRRST